jgi:hypothetical protein
VVQGLGAVQLRARLLFALDKFKRTTSDLIKRQPPYEGSVRANAVLAERKFSKDDSLFLTPVGKRKEGSGMPFNQ